MPFPRVTNATRSAFDLTCLDAERALAAAREALDLATAPGCQYAWGEADAVQRGVSRLRRSASATTRNAFAQALAVRERIEHPQMDATRAALAGVGG